MRGKPPLQWKCQNASDIFGWVSWQKCAYWVAQAGEITLEILIVYCAEDVKNL